MSCLHGAGCMIGAHVSSVVESLRAGVPTEIEAVIEARALAHAATNDTENCSMSGQFSPKGV